MPKKKDFLKETRQGKHGTEYLVNDRWYGKCWYDHLQEVTVNGKEMILEYYRRASDPLDDKLLDGWQIWVYGNDRPYYSPHCHMIKGDYNIEIHLYGMELYHMESPQNKNITWDNVPKQVKEVFMTWVNTPSVRDPNKTNGMFLLDYWDGENPNDTIEDFIKRNGLEKTIHPIVIEYLYAKPIEIDELIKSIFDVVLPLYQTNHELREKLHRIEDPIEFSRKVNLPFKFNEYNISPKIKKVIKDYERMCYEMISQ